MSIILILALSLLITEKLPLDLTAIGIMVILMITGILTPLVLLVFGSIVAAASLGLADIMVCALAGVFLMILFGCLQLRDAYRALPGNILLFIVGVIALGAAMEKTGATQLYAEIFLSLFSRLNPRAVLGGIILLTSLVTHLLSNNATGVLLLPIAVSEPAPVLLHPWVIRPIFWFMVRAVIVLQIT